MVAPTITGINPPSGAPAGGTQIWIKGSDFTGTTGITVGGNAVTSFTVSDDNNIVAVVSAGTLGAQDLIVTNGTGPTTLTDGFKYDNTRLIILKPTNPLFTGKRMERDDVHKKLLTQNRPINYPARLSSKVKKLIAEGYAQEL
jgi:hypothetical protein